MGRIEMLTCTSCPSSSQWGHDENTTFENLHCTLTLVNNLDLLQDLHHNLCIHNCIWFFIRQLTAEQESNLAKLIEKFCKRKAFVHVFLHLCQLGKLFNNFFEELLIIITNFEISDELWNH